MGEPDFTELYRRHVCCVYRCCLFIASSRQDAEDLTAEAFARLLSHHESIRSENVLPWLLKVARHLCADHLREKGRVTLCSLETVPDPSRCTRQAHDDELWQAVNQLPPLARHVIYFHVIQDLTFAETARRLGRGESTVKMAYYEGLRRLRRSLEEKDFSFENGRLLALATSHFSPQAQPDSTP